MDLGSVFAPLYDPLMSFAGWEMARRRVLADLSGSVLDVGCGTAMAAADIGGEYTGVDSRLAMLIRGRSGRLVCAEAEALPFADATFDNVVSSAVLGLIEPRARRRALQEMARVARGRLRILEPVAPLGPLRRTLALSRHPLHVAELTDAGWRVDSVGPRLYGGVYTLVCARPADQSR